MTTRRALWALIGAATLIRVAWAASMGGMANEAYYYMYAQNLDWSYFDHPPMVGLVSAAGLRLIGWAAPVLGLRLGFVALMAGSTWLMARLTARCFGDRAGFLAALALNATAFYGVKVGTLAEPDGPLLFFWLLTMDRLHVALLGPGRTRDWVAVGLAWGGALLCKHHAVLLPAGACLYLLMRPEARRCLRTPGPYLAAVIGGLMFAPVVLWNASHGWASFAYQGSRAGGFTGFHAEMFLEAMVAQVLYLTPWISVGIASMMIGLARRGPRKWTSAEVFSLGVALPPLCLFLGVATYRRIMPHWPMIGFVGLLPMLGKWLSDRLDARPASTRRWLAFSLAAPLALGSLIVVQARTGLLQDAKGRMLGLVKPIKDPTVDTIRWPQIADALKARGLLDRPDTFLFTDYWCFSAELAMATNRPSGVACYQRDSRSYTFWSRPEDWVGRDGIFVRLEDGLAPPTYYEPWFERVELLDSFPIVRAGTPMQTVKLYRCVRQTAPFLFGRAGAEAVPKPTSAIAVRPVEGSTR